MPATASVLQCREELRCGFAKTWQALGHYEAPEAHPGGCHLREGGKNHGRIIEGGAWRLHRDMWIAERDGDTARLSELEAEQERLMSEIGLRISAASEKIKPRELIPDEDAA